MSEKISPTLNKNKPSLRGMMGGGLTMVFVIGLLLIMGFGLVKAKSVQHDSGAAPNFTLTGFDGRKVTLSELRGRVVIINFWASWCLTCRQEAAYLEQTWRKYQDQCVVFIGVDYEDTDAKALAYLREFDITYINGPDIGTRISDAYNIKGVPETYFVDRDGQLQGVYIGPLEAPYLENKFEELLSLPYPNQSL
jgi:cytochrome c biogenesis protein CcmG/thiol:disulfide interchange protein DsbE